MFERYLWLAAAGSLILLHAQAPTAPVIRARGVTNLFTQEPAPGVVAQGGLVEITGLNLGPPQGAAATGSSWPKQLAGYDVIIGGKAAAIYSVSLGQILAQVPVDSNLGLVNVIVRHGSESSAPAHVIVTAVDPAVRTANDSGYGAYWGTSNGQTITLSADGLGPTNPKLATGDAASSDAPAVPATPISAYIGGLPASATATASTRMPGAFDVQIVAPDGARPGDLITLMAGRQAANFTLYQPMAAPDAQFVPAPPNLPDLATLADAGLNGNFLMATAARASDGCYAAVSVNAASRKMALASDCLTTANAALPPVVTPNNSNAIGALVGPPQGDAQTGISSTVKIFGASGDPITVNLPTPASVLTATPAGFIATLPGTPPQIAAIDAATGEFQVTPAPAGPGGGGAPTANLNINGLKSVYFSSGVGQNRLAVVVGDDPQKPTKAVFAVINPDGSVALTKDFPAGWLPLLTAVPPARNGQTPAPPRGTAAFDPGSRLYFVLARASDASKDSFAAFPLGEGDAKLVPFPDGWFAASCTADIRMFNLDLVNQLALAGSRVAESEFQAACSGTSFLTLDLDQASVTAIPLPDQGQLRVPATRTDTSLSQMNNYLFGVNLDPSRAGASDTLYVLDGVNGIVFTLHAAVSGFTDASLQQIPALNSILAQSINKTAGDQGLVLFDLDDQIVKNVPVPDGFTAVSAIADGASVCCLATRKLAARATRPGGANVMIYDMITGDISVVPNPEGVTMLGRPGPAGGLIFSNSRANTVAAVAYAGTRQAGIVVIRIP